MEDEDQLLARFSSFLRDNLLAVLLGCIGLIFLGYGLIGYSGGEAASEEIVIEDTTEQDQSSGVIMVDVSGAVNKPGVYELEADSRMRDAVSLAGGVSDDADHVFIAKNINLAQPLTDGMKVYIPSVSDAQTPSVLGHEDGKTSINNASSSQLEELPGIGSVTAEKIISNRPYASLEELLEKKSVGASVFEKIKDQITL